MCESEVLIYLKELTGQTDQRILKRLVARLVVRGYIRRQWADEYVVSGLPPRRLQMELEDIIAQEAKNGDDNFSTVS